jgi:pimeloyl-ACP methyl ester carboxylesterase
MNKTFSVKFMLICVFVGLLACNRDISTMPTIMSTQPEQIIPEQTETSINYTPIFENAPCPFQLPSGQVEGKTVECGYLIVPEQRVDPTRRSIKLAVAIFHPTGGAEHPDPIIYLMGGPGASILEFIYLSFNVIYSPILAAGRDLILFDQRGVGLSQPALDCPQAFDLSMDILDGEVEGQQLMDEEGKDLFREAYIACSKELSQIADLSTYHTIASTADVNDLRIALGYDQVNLWGGSYGTKLALEVMRDYPSNLRSIVLDSVYPPDKDLYLETPANLDRSLNLLFTTCTDHPNCETAYPRLEQTFYETLTQLDQKPIATNVINPLTGETYEMLFDGEAFFGLIFQMLYDTQALPILPQLIYEANQGDLRLISRIYGALLAQGQISSRGMSFSVQCSEEFAFSDPEQFSAVLKDYPNIALYLRNSYLGEFGYDVCSFWGAKKADRIENEPVTSDLPVLVLQGEFDPITPLDWGLHTIETLKNSYYFLFPGVAHGTVVTECAREMLIAFVNTPHQPPDDACILGMGEIVFIVPDTVTEAVTMEVFRNESKKIQGMAPVGWKEVASATYARSQSALDETVLIMDVAPSTTGAILERLTQTMGIDSDIESISQKIVGHFTWEFFRFDYQGLVVDLVLSGEDGRSYMVMLVSTLDEQKALYDQVFIPAVEALSPLQ